MSPSDSPASAPAKPAPSAAASAQAVAAAACADRDARRRLSDLQFAHADNLRREQLARADHTVRQLLLEHKALRASHTQALADLAAAKASILSLEAMVGARDAQLADLAPKKSK